jgi:hypothetical protein
VILACTGDGNQNALRGARAVLDVGRPDVLIGAGAAGGLSAGLSPGTLVAGAQVFDSSGLAAVAAPDWLDRARDAGALPASLLTVDRIVCTAKGRRSLSLGMPSGAPAAVDLESAFWARAAASSGVPSLILRSISDGADEELPGLLAACQAPGGPIRRACVARRALVRPADARRLFELRRRVRAGSQNLAEFLETLLNSDSQKHYD